MAMEVFVLVDELGPPWPVHDCYVNRIAFTSASRAEDLAFEEILARLRARKNVNETPPLD